VGNLSGKSSISFFFISIQLMAQDFVQIVPGMCEKRTLFYGVDKPHKVLPELVVFDNKNRTDVISEHYIEYFININMQLAFI